MVAEPIVKRRPILLDAGAVHRPIFLLVDFTPDVGGGSERMAGKLPVLVTLWRLRATMGGFESECPATLRVTQVRESSTTRGGKRRRPRRPIIELVSCKRRATAFPTVSERTRR